MDSSEIHYVTYDPEEIYKEMLYTYIESGGDVLYPGDEKEMLLRAVQSVLTQALAGVDHALRMATLRYATGEYLDLYGQTSPRDYESAVSFICMGGARLRPRGITKNAE